MNFQNEAEKHRSLDQIIEVIVLGSLFSLLLLVGTPILGKLVTQPEGGPSLTVVRDEVTQRP